jgi:hypothetical protein
MRFDEVKERLEGSYKYSNGIDWENEVTNPTLVPELFAELTQRIKKRSDNSSLLISEGKKSEIFFDVIDDNDLGAFAFSDFETN